MTPPPPPSIPAATASSNSTATGNHLGPSSDQPKDRPVSTVLDIDVDETSLFNMGSGSGPLSNTNTIQSSSAVVEEPSSAPSLPYHPLGSTPGQQESGTDTNPFSHYADAAAPFTPGEEMMVFDRGLLFTNSHPKRRQPPRSDPSSNGAILSAPLPTVAADSEPSTIKTTPTSSSLSPSSSTASTSSYSKSKSSLGSSGETAPAAARDTQSAPILMPPIIRQPVLSTSSTTVATPAYTVSSRSPSPNPVVSSSVQQLGEAGGNASRPQSRYATPPPAALRPDSICSFPDNSPLLAPNVLAAVDARLKEAARQRALGERSSNSSLRRSPLQQQQQQQGGSGSINIPGATHSNNSMVDSRASSVAPVLTHNTVLQSSDSIISREQLFDLLNGDDDELDLSEGNNNNHPEFLGKPRPGFIRQSSGAGGGGGNSHHSQRSSRRNSYSSSLASSHGGYSGSGIELNPKGERFLAASLPKPVSLRHSKRIELVSSSADLSSKKEQESRDTKSPHGGQKETTLAPSAATTKKEDGSQTSADTEFDPVAPMSTTNLIWQKSDWLKRQGRTSRKWRGICCVVGILAFIAVVAGIVLGFVTRKGKIDGLAPPPDPDKPVSVIPPITQFSPDPNLHKSFYGLNYNPAKSLMPWCGVTLQNVVDDVILISQLTNRIRLYGMDCSQADLTFQAINALNLNSTMKVVLTMWVDKDPVTVQRQYDTLFKVLDTYGTDMVQGISVGNEVIFRNDMSTTALGALMAKVRNEIKTRYGKTVPIFTSEIGNNLNSSVVAISDELSGNLHPYFAGTAVAEAAQWTIGQYNTTILENPAKSGVKGSISEVGWPSAPASAVYQTYAVPGVANLQTMVDTFICEANREAIPYYWFEYKDEPWKTDPKVPVEPYWGLFDKDGNLKVKIPNCPAP